MACRGFSHRFWAFISTRNKLCSRWFEVGTLGPQMTELLRRDGGLANDSIALSPQLETASSGEPMLCLFLSAHLVAQRRVGIRDSYLDDPNIGCGTEPPKFSASVCVFQIALPPRVNWLPGPSGSTGCHSSNK